MTRLFGTENHILEGSVDIQPSDLAKQSSMAIYKRNVGVKEKKKTRLLRLLKKNSKLLHRPARSSPSFYPPPPPGYFSRYRRKGPEGQSETTPATVRPVRQQHWMKSSGSDIDQILRLVPWNINQTKPALLLSHQQ